MTNPTPPSQSATRSTRLSLNVMLGLLAVLAPLSYLVGRVSTRWVAGTYLAFLTSGVSAVALGVMAGIPLGLFFGSLRSVKTHAATAPNNAKMERSILEQLRAELAEDKGLFEARRGSTTMFARIAYVTPFWATIKASGRLFVMSDAGFLGTIATAYYWLDQATHLETLAYEAKYSRSGSEGSELSAKHLINEARLLDGQLSSSLDSALLAIDQAIVALPKP